MASGWSITCAATNNTIVTLPVAPSTIAVINPLQVDEIYSDSNGTMLVSRYLKAKQVQLKGTFSTGQTNAQLMSTYFTPLEAMKRQIVTITDPDSQFGGNWVLTQFDYSRDQKGSWVYYTYTITIKQATGTSTIVVE
jgi:hypothetical protein